MSERWHAVVSGSYDGYEWELCCCSNGRHRRSCVLWQDSAANRINALEELIRDGMHGTGIEWRRRADVLLAIEGEPT